MFIYMNVILYCIKIQHRFQVLLVASVMSTVFLMTAFAEEAVEERGPFFVSNNGTYINNN